MDTRRLLIATFLALGAGAAIQAAPARELPDSIEAFAAEQQQEIMSQGQIARERIRRELWRQIETSRLAFIERQERAIEAQGAIALAEIKRDLDLIRFEGVLARNLPRPESRSDAPEIKVMKYYDR